MSGIFRMFNTTPPANPAPAAPAPTPVVAAEPTPPVSASKVQAYLDQLAAAPATGVAKYLIKLERDEFNRLNRPTQPTGVERYLSSQQQPAETPPPVQEGPTGVQRYLDELASTPVYHANTKVQGYLDQLAAAPKAVTGVDKYLVKLERDEFNRLNQPVQPTSVERYLAAQREAESIKPPPGPSGVERYLASLTSAAA